MKYLGTTPKLDGFYMPAEFAAHEAIWMIWPERSDNWRYGGKPAQAAFVNVAEAIAKYTKVYMAVSAEQYQNAYQLLSDNIHVVEMSNDDAWMRDVGPTFVINDKGERRAVDWEFNAWGGLHSGLYFPWDKDNQIAKKVAGYHNSLVYYADFVLEGGSIHSDGEGTIYTTEECLLNENRNPHLSKEEIEKNLCEYLGAEKVIWLGDGVYNDETDGHVDNIICVARPGEIILTWTDDENDPQYKISRAAEKALLSEKDAKGRTLKIHKIYQPGPIYITKDESLGVDAVDGTLPREEGDRLAGSYVNFLITNKAIIYPLLDEKYDGQARQKLQEIFPDYEVLGVPAREILLGGGNIHCITQQVPAV